MIPVSLGGNNVGFLFSISTWFASLALKDKIIGAIVSIFAKEGLEKIRRRVQASDIDKAYKKALKKWSPYSYGAGYYEQHQMRAILDELSLRCG